MAHISSIGAGMYSDLSIGFAAVTLTTADTVLPTAPGAITGWATDLFAIEQAITVNAPGVPTDIVATEFVRIANVREFPAIGTPPNIVNVPTYGQINIQNLNEENVSNLYTISGLER